MQNARDVIDNFLKDGGKTSSGQLPEHVAAAREAVREYLASRGIQTRNETTAANKTMLDAAMEGNLMGHLSNRLHFSKRTDKPTFEEKANEVLFEAELGAGLGALMAGPAGLVPGALAGTAAGLIRQALNLDPDGWDLE